MLVAAMVLTVLPIATVEAAVRPTRRILKQDVYGHMLPDSFYFYRNNLDETEKVLYDQIYANAYDADKYFEIATQVHYSKAVDILQAVRYDNPDLFWLFPYVNYTYDKNGYITSITLTFYDDAVENLDAYKETFYNYADSVLEVAMELDNDVEKVKFVHDFLCHSNVYIDVDHFDQDTMNQSAYSAIVKGKTLCAGYSTAFQYYMQRLGILCGIIYGYRNSTTHFWNFVNLDGEYYAIDVTLDDPIGNPPDTYYYNYFNITDSVISSDHSRHERSSAMPIAYGMKYSYSNYFGSRPGSDFNGINYGTPKSKLPNTYIVVPDITY